MIARAQKLMDREIASEPKAGQAPKKDGDEKDATMDEAGAAEDVSMQDASLLEDKVEAEVAQAEEATEAEVAQAEGATKAEVAQAEKAAEAEHGGDVVVPSSSSAGAAPGTPGMTRAKKYKTPEEVLDMLQPPGCKFTLGYRDHRFSSKFDVDAPGLEGKMKQKTFSKTFVERRGWREALQEVHAHNWKKWNIVRDRFPLRDGVEPQEPGNIPEDIFAALQPTIEGLPEVTRY